MDDGLEQNYPRCADDHKIDLILVVVDDGLIQSLQIYMWYQFESVLILVVVEDGLVHPFFQNNPT